MRLTYDTIDKIKDHLLQKYNLILENLGGGGSDQIFNVNIDDHCRIVCTVPKAWKRFKTTIQLEYNSKTLQRHETKSIKQTIKIIDKLMELIR